MDRRSFLMGGFLKPILRYTEAQVAKVGAVLPASRGPATSPLSAADPTRVARRKAPPPLRPPGAISEAAFLQDCTRCGDCITACPYQAIRIADARWGAAAGTPIVDPVLSPCLQCADAPCITSCGPKVLQRQPDTPLPAMGTARIDPYSCLAHQGTTCSACREQCPVPGAIRIEAGRPTVVTEVCTGCGVCAYVCPAPRNAVAIVPSPRISHVG